MTLTTLFLSNACVLLAARRDGPLYRLVLMMAPPRLIAARSECVVGARARARAGARCVCVRECASTRL